jgi:hypothetical protein
MRTRSLIILLAVAAAALALATGSGAAGGATGCSHSLTRPFLPWLDPGSYFLAPGGDFESTLDGWAVSGGARIVSGNETYHVGSPGDDSSLLLPPGSQVTSPSMCVSLDSPDLRLFVQNTDSLLSSLAVSVNYTDAGGNARTLPVGLVPGTRSWTLSLPVLFLANVQSILAINGQTSVSFTFTPLGSGGRWQVDDFYVDPIKHT